MEGTAKFSFRHLELLPNVYESNDSARLTLAFFVVESLAILGESLEKASEYCDYVYKCQLPYINGGGFRGSLFMGKQEYDNDEIPPYDPSNLTMTYTAILLLALLRDDFSRLDVKGIIRSIEDRQKPDGSFAPIPSGSESDIRLVYCASAISSLLGDFSGIDIPQTIAYIKRCRTYDGSYSQTPNGEGQGGTTYCALASLELLSSQIPSEQLISHKESDETLRWLSQRQIHGFQGRTNKDCDSCYSFWCRGAFESLKKLSNLPDDLEIFSDELDGDFLLSCSGKLGGIAKYPNEYPDVLHNCLGLSALSMAKSRSSSATTLKSINSTINIEITALEWLKSRINQL
ncbi:terpenoid cyclases/Protein prenyltransferase [Wallemia mellicola]|uniref:Terpenoid cyclases/Protein prenyltransferase n=2 Tax=Wallemia mellicola TaxID=1708541 RepID=A0A4T0Q3V1_9BASI|nr:terpenoid cyclases/Protein prenyltransferase [Wallemia mellicola CBS 633.66]TIB76942.1 hypothetical protein E3Q23_01616 [Wallemia mellicola]EIM19327.1 terpenoid cyclases/Protein prenyltransferase [Wallemia mellicola CBS 633.66]TIB80010.1 terpenoid cyclases/Protein prenyltransferase [Wallemia mellicola]TIB96031.1 terpenoid cyclases/Protein prenyltransferase [Wallemia mellicola]TIC05606.1 terpenoid cyclases/Protein prenyltransferase [Wallemia mellicola]|eukprot:XP_006960603.1 terpenoid cyclases/Protein prenyltransferase [Wallemia mellicola CBS 633.66]